MQHNKKPGDAVIFVDRDGNRHNALVIHAWDTTVNIVFINTNKNVDDDSFGHERIKETSVPFYEMGMSGFYINEPLLLPK